MGVGNEEVHPPEEVGPVRFGWGELERTWTEPIQVTLPLTWMTAFPKYMEIGREAK